jgi:hypothetical protein
VCVCVCVCEVVNSLSGVGEVAGIWEPRDFLFKKVF